MRTINSERIYSRNNYAIIMNEIYSDADCRENVRTRIISRTDSFTIIRVSYYDFDCEFHEFDIRVRTAR